MKGDGRTVSARIYKPARSAMQSGTRRTHRWQLDFDSDEPLTLDPLMGWTSNGDMKRQISLTFPTKEDAIAYAERHGLDYRVDDERPPRRHRIAYADNFRSNRRVPWTH